MKTRFASVFLLLGLLLTLPCWAQFPNKGFSVTSSSFTNPADGIVQYAVAPVNAQNQGPAVVRFLSATGTYSANVATIYNASGPWLVVTNTNPGGQTTNFWTSWDASSIPSNSIVLIQHLTTGTYDRGRTYSSSATNVTTQAAITTAPQPGDEVWYFTSQASIPVGAATITYYGGPLIYGQINKPLLVELDKATNSTINLMSGDYSP
ncbi:MAG: hypothetical protein KGL39_21375 [Patescibacteria group bacterium]|nr:hypothetical protein [Patescibacteria group bacterium]